MVVRCVTLPRPPPICPTITIEVGTLFGVVVPVGVNVRLFVRLIVKACPAGTVITTGDHVAGVVVVATDNGFNAAHVAVINQTMARVYFPNGDAIGRSLRVPDMKDQPPFRLSAPDADSWRRNSPTSAPWCHRAGSLWSAPRSD